MMRMLAGLLVGILLSAGSARAADVAAGKAVYDSGCVACHSSGLAGAPKLGDAVAWQPRIATGVAAMVATVRTGKGAMPPKGGMAALTEAQMLNAVHYMVAQSSAAPPPVAAAAPTKPAPVPKPGSVAAASAAPPVKAAPANTQLPAPAPPSPTRTPPVAQPSAPAVAVAPAPAPAPVAAPTRAPATAPVASAPAPAAVAAAAAALALAPPGGVNSFNRLLRPNLFNRPPAEDQIHDPGNDGTLALQPPLLAFNGLPRSNAGNRVDWGKSLTDGKIAPRADRLDANAKAAVMDLNIVREVKGSMPDVVYPHKQHTEWLDCSNCHPAIFKPQKGANQISMAGILLGQTCGVCHGKVAFPVSECRLCHSKAKPATAAAAAEALPKEAVPK